MTHQRRAMLIEDYAVIGDLQTAALVARDGSIDWVCLPRFDSPACFAALLDDEEAGHWRIGPVAADSSSTRRYDGDTVVLETVWDCPDGKVKVIDFMPPRGEAPDVVRIVEGLSGSVELASELRLRFDYGHIAPWVRVERGELAAVAGPDAVWLSSSLPVHAQDGSICTSSFTVSPGQREWFVLTYQPSHLRRPHRVDAEQALVDTQTYWHDWIRRCRYDGPWSDEVRRALLTLKTLTYQPTGGIVAAATTSLPEEIGGVRNWDYRYCWLRDATFTLQALLGTGYVEEARAWREWLVRAVAGDPSELQIMYGLDGSRRLHEYTLDWLDGYEGSKPVRIGNAAADQLQVDVWGEVLDGLHLGREAGLAIEEQAWDVQLALLDWLEGNWQRPDNGLWEMRGPRQHFVHSKVMAWAGVDRMVKTLERRRRLRGPVDRCRKLREQIHADVLAHGYDADRGTFTQFYGSRGLDAALLQIPRVGFLPWDDPRVVGTVKAVQEELSVHGLVRRYDPDADGGPDGLPGSEGVFLACSFWLADALAGSGRQEEAERLFEHLLSLRNDVGLMSEEYDPVTGRQLGNTPQAFSMIGLVNTARMLSGFTTTTSDGTGREGVGAGATPDRTHRSADPG